MDHGQQAACGVCEGAREPKAERGKSNVWLIHVRTFFTLFTADEDASN
jgi:hypothetical protein